jgi:membrane protease YdiL (CAAX protease family)
MEIVIKTNRLAIVGVVSGLIAFLILGTLLTAFRGIFPEPGSPIDTIMNQLRAALDLFTFLSLLIGILALRDIRKKGGTEKGKTLAWAGIILGAGPRVLIAGYFILALLFSQR